MPTYVYACKNCGYGFEQRQTFSDDALTTCPECGQDALRKVFNSVGIVFKGSGFYKTDSRQGGSGSTSGTASDSGSASSGGATSTPASSSADTAASATSTSGAGTGAAATAGGAGSGTSSTSATPSASPAGA